jgi:hypothetical protein
MRFSLLLASFYCDFGISNVATWHRCTANNHNVINRLKRNAFGFLRAIHTAGVKAMSLRNKVVVFTLGAIAAVAGLSLVFTSLKHASILVASAVWGS